jgi:hypothetical protein
MTAPVQSAILASMDDRLEIKRQLLASELERYFGETCPALAARWGSAIIGLAPPVLRELAGRLREFEAATDETNRQLNVAGVEALEDQEQAAQLLGRALASLERLDEFAQAIMKHLDELSPAG